MYINEITEWLKIEFLPLQLATPEQTINQLVNNAIRYFNNNAAVKHVEMVDITPSRIPVSERMRSVAYVYPASTTSQLNIQDFPMWTLLGIQVLDGLTSDLIMLAETYKSFMAYMGKDFQYSWLQADDGTVASFTETLTGSGLAWGNKTLQNIHVTEGSLVVVGGLETFTDNGSGVMVSNLSGGTNGTIDYTTGVVNLTWVTNTTTAIATYTYPCGGWIYHNNTPVGATKYCVVGTRRIIPDEDINNKFILDFILRYSKALLKMAEGNLLRKAGIINVANDGQALLDEGKDEIEKLQAELRANGRWIVFSNRI